jgi:hypothetical protein
MTIFITLIVLFTYQIACCLVQAEIPSKFSKYNLPQESSKMCTIDVKPFGNDAKTINIFEDIIQANANKFLFTTWAFNESSKDPQVHLLHSIYEQCTMNIIIEGPHADIKHLEIMSHYVARTGFGQLTQETQTIL